MTGFNYTRARATAERLIAKFGRSAALRRTTNSGTAYAPTRTPVDHPCRCAVLAYADTAIDGTRIKASDKQIYLSTAGLTIEPTTADEIVLDAVAHSIVAVKPLSPGGVVVFWEIQARV